MWPFLHLHARARCASGPQPEFLTGRRQLDRLRLFALCCLTAWWACPVLALDRSVGPEGAQIAIVKRALTFGLDGTNVRIGQIEGTGEPRTTHAALAGAITTRGVGPANNNHATGVAGILIGRPFTPGGGPEITGVASGARLWSTWFDDTIGADDFFRSTNWLTGNGVEIINMSDFLRGDARTAGTIFVDHVVANRNVIWVKSAGNGGPGAGTITQPGDAFNAIAVGALGADRLGNDSEDYTRVANYSSRGPVDGRRKPDIVAPGSLILMPSGGANNASQVNSGTSFAAPHVAGTAALLHHWGRAQGLIPDHLSTKAAILNSASKHVRDPNDGDRVWSVWRAATPASIPLNDAMGAGRLNAMAAVKQYVPGNRSDIGLQNATVNAGGGTATFNLFQGGQTLKPGSLVVATATWDRQVALNDPANPHLAASYTVTNLPDLDLELVNRQTGQVVARSNSVSNNVEHIYANVPSEGNYDLRVTNFGATNARFSLAWTSGTSDGLAFSVNGGANEAQSAEGLQFPVGANKFPNDVNSLGRAGPASFRTEGEVFTSSLDGTNMQRLSGALGSRSRVGPHNAPPAAMAVLDNTQRGVLGLVPGDNVDGLSWGRDGAIGGSTIVFSVDPAATGAAGTAVRHQAVDSPPGGAANTPFPTNPGGGNLTNGDEAAGDIFKTPALDAFGRYNSPVLNPAPPRRNELFADESELGLQAPARRGSLLGGEEDDLDALEMDNARLSVDWDGDGMHNSGVYFNLGRGSPSLTGGRSGNDIFISKSKDPDIGAFNHEPSSMFDFEVFADGENDIRLTADDSIDALILSDVGFEGNPEPNETLNFFDEALFSLDPTSPSGRPGDIYYTDFNRPFDPNLRWDMGGSLFALAAELGLLAGDNIDALDIFRVPEPSSLLLLSLALLVRRRRVA